MNTHYAPANRGFRHPNRKHHRKLVQNPINSMGFAMSMIGMDRIYMIAAHTDLKHRQEMAARIQKQRAEMERVRQAQAERHSQALDLLGVGSN